MAIPAMYDRAKVHAYCESLGFVEVRRLLKTESHFHMADREMVEAWLSVAEAQIAEGSTAEILALAKEANVLAREANIEARAANALARCARNIAAIAAITAIIALIASIHW